MKESFRKAMNSTINGLDLVASLSEIEVQEAEPVLESP